MKGAMTVGQLMIMLIVIVSLLFFLMYVFKPTWIYAIGLLKGPLNISKILPSEEISTTVPGGVVGVVPTPFKQLSGTREEILKAIAADLRACWNTVLRTKKDSLIWSEITFLKTDPVFTKQEVIDAVGGPSTDIGKSLDSKWGSGDQFDRGDALPGNIGYLICCDYDSNVWPIPNDVDLYITNNLKFNCE